MTLDYQYNPETDALTIVRVDHTDGWRFPVEDAETVQLADCDVPMAFVAAGDDIRPSWPLAQLARTVRRGTFTTLPDVPHDFWSTHPEVWARTVSERCAAVTGR